MIRIMRIFIQSCVCIGIMISCFKLSAQPITAAGQPAQLDIREASMNSIRVTLKPISFSDHFSFTPALAERIYPAPAISIRSIAQPIKKKIGNLFVEVLPNPLTLVVTTDQNEPVQRIVFEEDGKLSFKIGDHPVLGMGEGGPKPTRGTPWRSQAVQYDRRGQMDSMQPRWQSDMYGSRNPVAMLVGTEGWGLFVAMPWVHVDLTAKDKGVFIPWKAPEKVIEQNERNQQLNAGKGLPPVDKIVPGLYDFFVFDAHHPEKFMKDFSDITGPAVMPPKWALGYMQSHRTLQDDYQMTSIVDTFRMKKIPIDAVIYLGTGFTPRGWNKMQPSFEFNPEVFKRDPQQVINDFHKKQVKVVLHMVPWDRDKLPSLYGSIPMKQGESTTSLSHIANYWKQHEPLVKMGVDAFWPDEGDWFNLYERIKRHQLYYQGHLSTNSKLRPWSLQRNGYPGIAQWGGWVWSGDTESSWKTLEAQIAVGINYSLSIAPFWGSDIGGFYPATDYSGEMYARWHQFAAFNASFRSHGRTWWLHLPWGWSLSSMGPKENRNNPPESVLNDYSIEPVIKQYNELRYQLMPYTYTVAWQARTKGLPMMRALWLHYPKDKIAAGIGDEFLWGKDILVAPVYENKATARTVYLPEGAWYDWWTNEKLNGGQKIVKNVDLSVMPLYVKAGAIIPMDTIKQYTDEPTTAPLRIKIYTGADGEFELYEDDGFTQDYLKGVATRTIFKWSNKNQVLTIEPVIEKLANKQQSKNMIIEWVVEKKTKKITFKGSKMQLKL